MGTEGQTDMAQLIFSFGNFADVTENDPNVTVSVEGKNDPEVT
jgi:hypothetical protein